MGRLHVTTSVYRDTIKDVKRLRRDCQGIVLIYLAIFALMKHFIFFPLGRKIWGFCIATSSAPYLLNSNVKMILKNPQLIVVGLILVYGFYIITIWEISGIILCMEYINQGTPPRLLSLFRLSFNHMKHLAAPRNWLFFFYVILMLPFVDLYNASGLLSGFSVPEYIEQFIESRWYLLIPFFLLFLVTAFLSLRWIYAIQSAILKRKDFKDARRESVFLIKKRTIRQLLDLVYFTFSETIRIAIIPGAISLIVIIISLFLTRKVESASLSTTLIYGDIFWKLFKKLVQFFLSISVMSYLIVTYKHLLDKFTLTQGILLERTGIKKRGHIFKFLYLKTLCFGGLLIGCVILYGISNLMFSAYPEFAEDFIDKKVVIAHKGYCSLAPENTMEAFEKAYEKKAGMIEFDVRCSKDGIPIVIHDASIMSACGIDKEVYDMNYDEIKSYNASYGFEESQFPDAYIPTLEEVVKEYGNKIPLLIEIKMDDRTPDLPKQILDILKKYDCVENCQIHSGSYLALEKVKEVNSDMPCGLIIAFGAGSYQSLPCADFFSVEHTFVNESMLDHIHGVDKKVYAWTVNEESSVNAIKKGSVDAVITDYPETVYQIFHENDSVIRVFLDEVTVDMDIQEENSDFENQDY